MNPRDLGVEPRIPATKPDGPQADDGATAGDDSLTRSLQWVLRHYGIERTALSLYDGLPFDGWVTPLLAQRAMQAAGFQARLDERPFDELHEALLPAVLMLHDGQACVLVRRNERVGDALPDYQIAGPDGDATRTVTTEWLDEMSTGHVLLLKHQPRGDTRGEALLDGTGRSAGGWLWRTLWNYRRYYRDAAVASVLVNVLTIVSGLFAMHVYDRVIPHKAYATLWSLAIGAMVAMVFEATARQLRTYLLDLAGKKADVVLASALFRHTLGIRLEHMPDSAGTLAHQLREFETIRDFGASASLAVLTDLPFVLLFVGMVFVIGGELGWVLALTIPLLMIAAFGMQWPQRRLMRANLRDSSQLHGIMIESLEGMETLRGSGASGFMQKRYEETMTAAAMSAVRSRALSNWVTNLVQFSQQAQMVVMLIWGTYLIHDNRLSTGALVGAVMFSNRAIAPLSQFTSLAARYQGARAALAALNKLMRLPTEREADREYVSRPRLAGAITLHGAGFAYPSQQQHGARAALRPVNLGIRPGERIAIVGKIGSGKSTLLKLISGLYQPTEGQIHLDGIDQRQIDPGDLRSHIGLVSQDTRLFHGTLRENVMLGRPNASWDAYLSAARLTGLDSIAAGHPLGHDLPISEQGAGLSGGQRQLVALARALVTRPRVLLLDEPTSAMDLQTENQFILRLQGIVQQRTVIIVTHRPSLLPLVDRILVVDDGRIVADGPKDKVLALLAGTPGAGVAASQPVADLQASAMAGGAGAGAPSPRQGNAR